jgi:hypothetical protein
MDGPIDAPASGQGRIGRIDHGVHRNLGDIALVENDFPSARTHPLHTSITIVL